MIAEFDVQIPSETVPDEITGFNGNKWNTIIPEDDVLVSEPPQEAIVQKPGVLLFSTLPCSACVSASRHQRF